MSERIKILHVLPLGGVGGAEKFVHSLCRFHDKSRFDISVCILFPFTGYAVADQIAASGLEIIKLNMSNGFDILRASRLISLIKKNNTDIINIHGQNPLGKLCSILGSAPVVIHTDHGTTAGSPVRRKGRVVYFNRLLTPYIDQFIAISKGMEKSLRSREKIPASKISLIYNGVDVASISAVACNKEELKRSLGIPSHTPVLGTVGRLVPEKQYPLMFEVLALLKKAHITFSVLIAGDGPQRQHLEHLIRKLDLDDRVLLLGERSDVYPLLEIMDLFLFSSGGEAFSITVLEAMAKSRPIIAFDVEGVNEAVIDGETGYLVPFADVGAFADKVKVLIQSPELAHRMGRAAFERVSTEFDIKENIRRTEALYDRLLLAKYKAPVARM